MTELMFPKELMLIKQVNEKSMLMFPKELMLIKQVNEKSMIFVTIGIFQKTFQPYVCNGYHDVLMMPINLRHIAILKMHAVGYRCIISGSRKCEAINLM